MDEQSGESKEEEVMSEEVSRKWSNWYRNDVDEEIKGVDSRDKVEHNERSDRLLLERMMTVVE